KPRLVLWFYFEGNDLVDLQDETQHALLMAYLGDFSQHLFGREAESDKVLLDFVEAERADYAKELQRNAEEKANRSRIGPVIDGVSGFGRLASLRTRFGLVQGTSVREKEVSGGVEAQMGLFKKILALAKTRVGSWGGSMHFVYLPNWTRYD